MSPLHLFVGRACRNDRGSVAIMFAMLMVVIFGFLALAVDIGRSYNASNRLAQTLDAAALAGAKLLGDDNVSDSDITDRVTAFVDAQPPINGVPVSKFAQVVVAIDRLKSSVTASGSGVLKTSFASVVGISQVQIAKSSTVIYKIKNVELAMSLDVTGSMSSTPTGDTKSKIDSLKGVAANVVDTLYSQAINDTSIRIAIAPFSSAVNAGSYASQVTSPPPSSPGSYYPNNYNYNNNSSSGTCVVERTGSSNATDAAPYGVDQLRSLSAVGGGTGACPADPIMPLSGRSQQSNIKSTIANFTPGGSTAGHIGAAWGMYLLSPNWNGIFSGTQKPGPYNDPNVSKNFVLMTDGLFNTSYLTGASVNSATAISESYTQLNALCTNMKANGINIFTIGFGLNDATAKTELGKCASSTASFFPVANGTELQTAFDAIVAKLNQLRVTN
jgi:Flp pilus assembly protein TadG